MAQHECAQGRQEEKRVRRHSLRPAEGTFWASFPSSGSGRKSQDGGPHSTEAAKDSVIRNSTHGDEVNKAWHGDPEAWDAAEAGTPARHWRRRHGVTGLSKWSQ